MKVLSTAAAVLVGMSTFQALAGETDDWNGRIGLNMPSECEISSDVKATLGATTIGITANPNSFHNFGVAATLSGVDANSNGLLDQDFTIGILFDEQSFCNYTHRFSVERNFGGFARHSGATPNAISDAFLINVPYKLTVKNGTWDPKVTNGIELQQLAHTAIDPHSPSGFTGWTAKDSDTVSNIPPFHNNGQTTAGENNLTEGLELTLAYDASAAGTAITSPYLRGQYHEYLHLRIGGAL